MTVEERIKKLQARLGVSIDGDVGNETLDAIDKVIDGTWAAPPPAPRAAPVADIQPRQSARTITSIAVHCSATPEGQVFTAADIDRWHRGQGWNGIGYNAVVRLDGTIERGRDERLVPSHAQGFNSNSIAICYIGGVDANGAPKDTRTPAQKAALRRWLEEKKRQYPRAEIKGHRDYAGVTKACPSFDAKREYGDI